jgi:hypothetical protein
MIEETTTHPGTELTDEERVTNLINCGNAVSLVTYEEFRKKLGDGHELLPQLKACSRVAAIISSDEEAKTVTYLGAGTYAGFFKLPEYAGGFNFGQENPRIDLDNGTTVWGCECWWGPTEAVQQQLEKFKERGYDIVMVNIDEIRAAHAAEAASDDTAD